MLSCKEREAGSESSGLSFGMYMLFGTFVKIFREKNIFSIYFQNYPGKWAACIAILWEL